MTSHIDRSQATTRRRRPLRLAVLHPDHAPRWPRPVAITATILNFLTGFIFMVFGFSHPGTTKTVAYTLFGLIPVPVPHSILEGYDGVLNPLMAPTFVQFLLFTAAWAFTGYLYRQLLTRAEAANPGALIRPWHAWVPVLNDIQLLRIAGISPWWAVFALVPYGSVVLQVTTLVAAHRISVRVGRGRRYWWVFLFAAMVWYATIAYHENEVAETTSPDPDETAAAAQPA